MTRPPAARPLPTDLEWLCFAAALLSTAQVPNGPPGEVGAAPAPAAAGFAPGGQGRRARRGSPLGGFPAPARLPFTVQPGEGTAGPLPGNRRLLFRSRRAGEALLLPGRRCSPLGDWPSRTLPLSRRKPGGLALPAFGTAGLWPCRYPALVPVGRAAEFGKAVARRRRQAPGTVARKTLRLGCNPRAARLQGFPAARLERLLGLLRTGEGQKKPTPGF